MLSPKRTKYRKMQKLRIRGVARTGSEISFGDFGLQVTVAGWLSARQIEAARIAMTRYVKRRGQIWIRVFPDKPITKKPAETRMGTGKGGVEFWVAPVGAGRVLYEMRGVDEATAKEAFRLAATKLPLPTRFLRRNEVIA
jgi:large subunit ribosomal protein L16